MKYPKFKVGNTYRYQHHPKTYTCVGESLDGLPIMQARGTAVFTPFGLEERLDHWSEYKEPETGVLTGCHIVKNIKSEKVHAVSAENIQYFSSTQYKILAKVDIPWTEGQGL